MDRFLLILLILTVIFLGVTYFIYTLSKQIKFIKYLPGIICAILAGYYFYVARQPSTGFEGIALILLMIMLAWISLVNFVTGVFLDFIMPVLRRKKE